MRKLRWGSRRAWFATLMLISFVLKTQFHIEIEEVDKFIDLILIAAAAWGIYDVE